MPYGNRILATFPSCYNSQHCFLHCLENLPHDFRLSLSLSLFHMTDQDFVVYMTTTGVSQMILRPTHSVCFIHWTWCFVQNNALVICNWCLCISLLLPWADHCLVGFGFPGMQVLCRVEGTIVCLTPVANESGWFHECSVMSSSEARVGRDLEATEWGQVPSAPSAVTAKPCEQELQLALQEIRDRHHTRGKSLKAPAPSHSLQIPEHDQVAPTVS